MQIHVAHLNCQDDGHDLIANLHLFSVFLSGNSTFYFLLGKNPQIEDIGSNESR